MAVKPVSTNPTYEQRAFRDAPFVIVDQLNEGDWMYHDVCCDDEFTAPRQVLKWTEDRSHISCYDVIRNKLCQVPIHSMRDNAAYYRQVPAELVPYANAYALMRALTLSKVSDQSLHEKGHAMIRERFEALSTMMEDFTSMPRDICRLVAAYERDCHPPVAFVKKQDIQNTKWCKRCGPAELESPAASD